jgi:hypothetical protein
VYSGRQVKSLRTSLLLVGFQPSSIAMALARVAQAVQQAVLANARVAPSAALCSGQGVFSRFFASGYLDRNEVTERILTQVKNFEKIDSSKVRMEDWAACAADLRSTP